MMTKKEFKKLEKDLKVAHEEVQKAKKDLDEKKPGAYVYFDRAYNEYMRLSKIHSKECEERLDNSSLADFSPELYDALKNLMNIVK